MAAALQVTHGRGTRHPLLRLLMGRGAEGCTPLARYRDIPPAASVPLLTDKSAAPVSWTTRLAGSAVKPAGHTQRRYTAMKKLRIVILRFGTA